VAAWAAPRSTSRVPSRGEVPRASTKDQLPRVKTYVPILRGLPSSQTSWLAADVIAGLTLWGLVVPEAMAYAGIAGLAKGGDVTLYVDGEQVGEGRVGATMPMIFSLDETMDVGCETGSMVSEDYADKANKSKGRIAWVQLDQGADDHDHLISPEERWHVAMTRQ
jgi:hypothetical protein